MVHNFSKRLWAERNLPGGVGGATWPNILFLVGKSLFQSVTGCIGFEIKIEKTGLKARNTTYWFRDTSIN